MLKTNVYFSEWNNMCVIEMVVINDSLPGKMVIVNSCVLVF